MKKVFIFCTVLILALAQSPTNQASDLNPTQEKQFVALVGQVISGSINPQASEQALHNLKLGELEKGYLFIRVNPTEAVDVAIGLYSNQTRELVHGCMDNSEDSCYVPREKLVANEVYVILVACKVETRYLVYTYWGDVEHINANEELRFTFEEKDPTQIFHLELKQEEQYEQIRIILKPETGRAPNDNLKLYANVQSKGNPTQEKHDFKSIHVWGDAEAIFLSKEQLQGQKIIIIYIAGSASTVYSFICQSLNGTHHDIEINETVHDYITKDQKIMYHFNFSLDEKSDYFALKASLFTGEINVAFYYDKEKKNAYTKQPAQYMSDIEFIIKRDELRDDFSIYMEVSCPDSSAIYLLTMQGRKLGQAFQITENIYEFLPVGKTQEAAYFTHSIMNSAVSLINNQLIYEFDVIFVQGDFDLTFYACEPKSATQLCMDHLSKNFQGSVRKLESPSQPIGSKVQYRIEVDRSLLRPVNSLEGKILIVCVISLEGNAKSGMIALQYSNPNTIKQLRENHVYEDRLNMQEVKYYKYINNDPTVKSIKIFLNEVSGLINVFVDRSDFRSITGSYTSSPTAIQPTENEKSLYIITEGLDKQIFVAVRGLVSSIYTLAVSAVHEDHTLSSYLTLAEDIEYELKILPFQFQNVEIHPIGNEVQFEYQSEGGEITICQLNEKGGCFKDQQNQPLLQTSSRGSMKLNSSHTRVLKFRIANYVNISSSDKNPREKSKLIRTTRIKMIYHSTEQNHCEEKKINKVYSQLTKTGSCFKFTLPLSSDIEVFQARQDNGDTFTAFFACRKRIQPVIKDERFIISGAMLQQGCPDGNNIYILMAVADGDKIVDRRDIRIKYSVEYANDTVWLADGVGYHANGRAIEGTIRTFFYDVLEPAHPVTVSLLNQKGKQKFFISITTNQQKYKDVTEATALLSSENSTFHENPTVIIEKKHFNQSKCNKDCVVIVSIYSKQKAGTQIQYTLQVTQNEILLEEDGISGNFLAKGSVAYYRYEVRNDKTNLFIKASDNDRKCENIYLANRPFPSPSNYLVQESSGNLVYKQAYKKTYYIAIFAREDCDYHLSVSESEVSLTKLQFGSYYDLNLEKGEKKWFYNHHSANSTFKVSSLLKYGEIKIYANSTVLNSSTFSAIKNNKIDVDTFNYKTQYANVLQISSKSSAFCLNCNYLIYIEAMEKTSTTIFMGSSNSKIELSSNKYFNDVIIDDQEAITMAIFDQIQDGMIEVNVYNGKVAINMSYHDSSILKEYAMQKQTYSDRYSFESRIGLTEPIVIKVSALEVPAVYSLKMIPDTHAHGENDSDSKSDGKLKHEVNLGKHTYLNLKDGQEQCLTGYLKNKEKEQIYVSCDIDSQMSLQKLRITAKLEGKATENFKVDYVGNILSINFIHQSVFFVNAIPYELCFSGDLEADQIFALNAFQSSNVNLLHADTEMLVRNQSIFVMYPQGNILVDVFQCVGKSDIIYSMDEAGLKDSKTRDLDIVGIPGQNHAVKIQSYLTLYLKVKGELATVVWTRFEPSQERGVGYNKYSIGGNLQYRTSFNKISFKMGSVYNIKETKTKVRSIRYILFISNDKQKLQSAVQCEMKDPKVFTATTQYNEVDKQRKLHINVQKSELAKVIDMNSTVYYNVIADLTLLPPNETVEEEHYRFIYYRQSVDGVAFSLNRLESLQQGYMVVLVGATVVIGALLIMYGFARWIVPVIGKIKNRYLVEENDEKQLEGMPVPPSSDRNQIEANNIETEDKMN